MTRSAATRFVRERVVALGIALVALVCAIATGALAGPSEALRRAAGLDVVGLLGHARAGTLLTSVLIANGPAELLLVLAATVLVVGGAERVLGHGRTLLAWIVTAVAGGLVGTALQGAGLLARRFWTTPPANLLVLQPETPVLGVLLTASAFAGPLWRRRIRFVVLAALVVLLLYSGQPEDLDHLAGALAGLVLGALLARRRPRLAFPHGSHQETRSLLAAIVAVGAIGPLVAVVQPVGYGLLRPLGRLFQDPLPLGDRVRDTCALGHTAATCDRVARVAVLGWSGTVVLALLPLAVLLVAAVAVQRGRRVGVWLTVGVNGLLAALAALYYGLFPAMGDPDRFQDVRSAVTLQSALAVLVPLGIAAAAVAWRQHCPVLPDRRVLVLGAVATGGVALAAAGVYVGVGLLLARQFAPRAGIGELLTALPERFVPVGFLRYGPQPLLPAGPGAALLQGWLGTAAWLMLLTAAVVVAVNGQVPTTGREQARLRALLRRGSAGSIAWMTTWPGNTTWFSEDGQHAVAYREGSGVALTIGEPVGDPQGRAAAARAFALFCSDRGLVPAFYAVGPGFAAELADRGMPWSSIDVGDDTVIDPAAFTMRGKHWQDVRSSINRADRAGIRAEWTDWPSLPLAQRAQIEAISEEWVAEKRLPELGFTLGGPAELRDREVRLMLAVGPEGRVEAATSWLPTWRDGELVGLTLDFMRRRPDSINGVMEFLIARVLEHAREAGLAFVSLSVAPLSGAGEDDDALQRVLGAVARLLEPAYGFRSLAAYKEKFRPEHRPQLVVFPDAVALPAITLAIARAYLPDRSLRALGRVLGGRRAEPEPRTAGRRPPAGPPPVLPAERESEPAGDAERVR